MSQMDQTIRVWTKTRRILQYVGICFLLLFFFYSYRVVKPFGSQYETDKKAFYLAKKNSTIALNEVKEQAKGTKAYEEYLEARKLQQKAFDKYTATIDSIKVFGFDTFHHFWERFGKNTEDLLFAIWVCYLLFFSPKAKDKIMLYGRVAICLVFISTKIFTYTWIFLKFEDFSLYFYVFMTFISAFTVVWYLYFLFKNKKTKEEVLSEDLMRLLKFTFKNTKPEKREEMLSVIEKIAKRA